MSFFDEGDEPTRVTSRAPRPRRGGDGGTRGGGPREPVRRPDRQTVRSRQAIAVGVLLVLALLVIFGVKGCVDSRQQNALKDYNRDVTSVITSSDRDVGRAFFQLISGGSAQGRDLQVQVNQLRLAADEDARRARGFDPADGMKDAHRNLLLVLDFRAGGLRRIADLLPTALGRGQPAEQATNRIAGQMQAFLASDVVYDLRVAPLIKQVLDDHGITGQRIPDSQFMPDISWLSPQTVADRLGSEAATGTQEPAPGLHGHGLTSVAVGSTTLQPSPAVNRVPASGNVTFAVTFQNQGDNDESNVRVSITVRGAGRRITARKTVSQPTAGAPATVEIPLGQTPPVGTATVEVVVAAVRGEQKTDNNRQQYTVIFTR
ncbi:MAG: hypothetical protein QOD81_2870 [Solirubrobacteraceae bacterium]|nr:hypothetical protein [Solirubrobacteraceae bacterium]